MTAGDAAPWGPRGTRPVTVTAAQAAAGATIVKGPCRLAGWSLIAGTAQATSSNEGAALSPAAGATIASIALPAGVFAVTWQVELTGAAAAADQNNFQLTNGATQVAVSLNAGAAGVYAQLGQTVVIPAGGATLAVKSIGAGTVGITYSAVVDAQPADAATGIIQDGGQLVANVAIGPGLSGTTMLGGDGVEITTDLQVVTSIGQLSGVLFVRGLIGDA